MESQPAHFRTVAKSAAQCGEAKLFTAWQPGSKEEGSRDIIPTTSPKHHQPETNLNTQASGGIVKITTTIMSLRLINKEANKPEWAC